MEEDLKKRGYSQEEAYFHKLNKALIEKTKARKGQGDKKKEDKEKGQSNKEGARNAV